MIFLLIAYGTYAAIVIPKESSPDIKFGLVQITTVYPWANPLDIDEIITEKVEKEIKDIEGVDKFESSSSVGISSVVITLENWVDVNNFMNEVKQNIDRISFPEDVTDPVVSEISTDNEVLFQMQLYWSRDEFTMNHMRSVAQSFKEQIEWKAGIVDVKIDGIPGDSDYDLTVELNAGKLEEYGLTIAGIVQTIRAFNQNLPLWNHTLWDLTYDYRISWERTQIKEILEIPLQLPQWWGYITIGDIAQISRNYKNDTVSYGGEQWTDNNYAVGLTLYKANRTNIFQTSSDAKKVIEDTLASPLFQWIQATYTRDLSDIIIDDYKNLWTNGWQAVLLIFLVTRFFIGFRQSLIATLAMPISFFVTFIFLNSIGATLNFMTNFSLVLTFGMGIDTVIVIIEAAYEYMKKWFDPKTAILISMKNYAFPNISSSLCNMIVFLPMIMLPGIIGKFLAFIPITVFVTLFASTVLASTVNNALFSKVNKDLPYYYEDDDKEWTFTPEEHEILDEMRKWKEMRGRMTQPWSDRMVQIVADKYVRVLTWILETKFRRVASYSIPVIALIASFIFLAPSIGFVLFPSGDNPYMDFQIIAKEGTTVAGMQKAAEGVDSILSDIPEVKSYQIDINKTQIDLLVILTKKDLRTRNSFDIQDEVFEKLTYLKEAGYKVEWKVRAWWPPQGKPVGIKLVADSSFQLNELKRISLDFEEFLKAQEGTLNVTNSSTNNPWQFNFTLDADKLAQLGLTPQDIQFELYAALNGTKAGVINLENIERDIVVKFAWFDEEVTPDRVLDLTLTTRQWPIKVWTIASYAVNQALSTIRRVDGDIVITVESDVQLWVAPTAIQPQLDAYATDYVYPSGLWYKKAGEGEENKELIQATFVALWLALFLVFTILVFEFNSFGKPLIILYSILTALLGANIWMYVTWNPYSMPFMIWFISLIGIVVNMAIFLVDRMNENMSRGLPVRQAIIEAGTTRFKAVIISSVTTIFGIIGLAFQDEFRAWLWFTVVFGLLFCAFITLFAVPSLYYTAAMREERKQSMRI